MPYVWQLRDQSVKPPSKTSDSATIVNALLAERGITSDEERDLFLHPDYYRDVHDPFLFAAMRKVVDRISQAITENESIVVYADYDADGVCSAAVLVSSLKALGANAVTVYIPHREEEGYGLNTKAIEKFIAAGVNLLITLDCGTTNIAEIALASESGIEVIVIDHHHVPEEMPNSYALLNAKMSNETYPYIHLASVGMAFKVSSALFKDRVANNPDELEKWNIFEKWLLDLVAIATVTDLVPLHGENRVLLIYGLLVLNKTKRPGLAALVALSGGTLGNLTAESIAFQIGPRINAAGRMGDAMKAYELLMADNEEDAIRLAKVLDESNRARQRLTQEVTSAATKALANNENKNVLVAVGDDWPIGLVGLVASRLLERHNRPVLVISRTSSGLVGSGRSVPQFNIIEAMHAVPELFIKFGGHAQACGFTLPDDNAVEKLTKHLNELASKKFFEGMQGPVLALSAVLELRHINDDFFQSLQQFEPFGMENKRPIFLFGGVSVVSCSAVGAEKKHLKLMLSDNQGHVATGIGFKLGSWYKKLSLGEPIDLAAEIIQNEWRGNYDVQLRIIDIRKALP
ncbi:single-stranded-DNA-specific exonuclease RecJ [Candidatus Uhrbacteria bacterium CG10_big_fil_rev_8_21_14_0_10_48_11]|uniref:Single-stranded-DNA-specific exonuclease RecJ n=1 Tax=Candidatus Uhrbacteria bacterium CG10_big_fil_rev_8_21_14_0_10_48_11 TaxID=1975037 RepID=A0A2M8LFK6_9BACT|nr:MAG: single-stranded-DNA-specific exonuclease RecJ [Candidatus Uhrbacteria bacterium CG10_big_fil_rev_8_21_14_0_10_48_11]